MNAVPVNRRGKEWRLIARSRVFHVTLLLNSLVLSVVALLFCEHATHSSEFCEVLPPLPVLCFLRNMAVHELRICLTVSRIANNVAFYLQTVRSFLEDTLAGRPRNIGRVSGSPEVMCGRCDIALTVSAFRYHTARQTPLKKRRLVIFCSSASPSSGSRRITPRHFPESCIVATQAPSHDQ